MWDSYLQDGSFYGIYGQMYNIDGNKVGSEFQINTYTGNNQYWPAIASLINGGFVVTWQSEGQDGSDYGIYAQIFDEYANRVKSGFLVNTWTNDVQGRRPQVTSLLNGDFVVVWHSNLQDGSLLGVYGQIFDIIGNKIGIEFQINTFTSGEQSWPHIASLNDGGFVVAWHSLYEDGSRLWCFYANV